MRKKTIVQFVFLVSCYLSFDNSSLCDVRDGNKKPYLENQRSSRAFYWN